MVQNTMGMSGTKDFDTISVKIIIILIIIYLTTNFSREGYMRSMQ
jgi:hypothetical protein